MVKGIVMHASETTKLPNYPQKNMYTNKIQQPKLYILKSLSLFDVII